MLRFSAFPLYAYVLLTSVSRTSLHLDFSGMIGDHKEIIKKKIWDLTASQSSEHSYWNQIIEAISSVLCTFFQDVLRASYQLTSSKGTFSTTTSLTFKFWDDFSLFRLSHDQRYEIKKKLLVGETPQKGKNSAQNAKSYHSNHVWAVDYRYS